ncbi:unnamed protein product [Didymodactylos carnosus]|uniref:Autophagy-related protein n=1 Tax=Didymodactylos carnosus TaxID=1234261 RepID=A0A814D839_9BILA|nr:unnamed protein product [Didymodactylos carnosus]CAF1363008.1 unnamed protein product [Didymodactylos carnosus]CAF3726423.1 unnamed protein product [Didymodactylos carnosus]CAF4172774.1 unnamed protein product [Didymodactylos carnosus]
MMNWHYKQQNLLSNRIQESDRIRRRYPDRVPLIVQSNYDDRLSSTNSNMNYSLFKSFTTSTSSSDLTTTGFRYRLEHEKYLVPNELSFGQFAYNIRKRLRLRSENALFFYLGKHFCQPTLSSTMEQLYKEFKDDDGFLYNTLDVPIDSRLHHNPNVNSSRLDEVQAFDLPYLNKLDMISQNKGG